MSLPALVLPAPLGAQASQAPRNDARPVVVEVDGGFRWEDAAIGAAAATGAGFAVFGLIVVLQPIRRGGDR